MQVETMKIKADTEKGYRIINHADFDAKAHQPFDENESARRERNLRDQEATDKLAAERRAQANFGQVDGGAGLDSGRNPSGTYSEPTPTDIRYPDKTATEFENNLGGTIGKSAAGLRVEAGIEDKPGGLKPEVHESVQANEDAAALAAAQARKEGPRNETVAIALDKAKGEEGDGDLDTMTVAQLRAYAEKNEIDLGDATRKDDIRAAIDLAGQ